jgi:sporulation-control protein spo0M
MFGTVKKILGIEGVKLELIVPAETSQATKTIEGIIKLTSLSDKNVIESIDLSFVEKYARGRGERKLINEYILGELTLSQTITISKNDVVEVPFILTYITGKSAMDKMGDNNFLVRGLVSLAKKASAVSSTYTLRAEAKVKGTTLNPFDKKVVVVK